MYRKYIKIILTLILIFQNQFVFSESINSDCENVVNNYCLLDYMGSRLRGDSLFKNTLWKEEPGWDSFDVIESFQIIKKEGLSITVKFYIYGTVDSEGFKCKKKEQLVKFELMDINGEKKISKPMYPPKVSTQSAHDIINDYLVKKPNELKNKYLPIKGCTWGDSLAD